MRTIITTAVFLLAPAGALAQTAEPPVGQSPTQTAEQIIAADIGECRVQRAIMTSEIARMQRELLRLRAQLARQAPELPSQQ